MSRRWAGFAAAVACSCLALTACTTDTDPVSQGDAEPTASRAPAPVRTTPAPPEEEPVVLVVHATDPRSSMTLDAAHAALRGRLSSLQVVAAQGMPVGPDVPELAQEKVLRQVERAPGTLGVVPLSALRPTVKRLLVGGIDPLRQPGRYPVTVAGTAPGHPVTLTVVGDVMLARGVTDPAGALAPMGDRLRSADITVGNLESTLSTAGPPQQGGDSFGGGPELLQLLRRAGFDALSLANNHTGDFGDQALVETVRLLEGAGLRPFGAGRDLLQAGRPAVVEVDGTTFGFLGFNAIGETPMAAVGIPGAFSVRMPPRTGPLNRADLRFLLDHVRVLNGRVDVVVVLPHWGTQYTHTPEEVQRLVSRRLVDAGADLVVGGHPHWVQGLDVHRGVVVAHSLGNFVFDMDFMTETQQGVVLEATYWNDELKAVDLVPYRIDAAFAPRPASPDEAREILADVWSTSTGPFSAG